MSSPKKQKGMHLSIASWTITSDSRFDDLAERYPYDPLTRSGLADGDHARGKLEHVWLECLVRQLYEMSRQQLRLRLKQPLARFDELMAALVAADLATIEGDVAYPHGTEGRIEWLARMRGVQPEARRLGGQVRAKSAKRNASGRFAPSQLVQLHQLAGETGIELDQLVKDEPCLANSESCLASLELPLATRHIPFTGDVAPLASQLPASCPPAQLVQLPSPNAAQSQVSTGQLVSQLDQPAGPADTSYQLEPAALSWSPPADLVLDLDLVLSKKKSGKRRELRLPDPVALSIAIEMAQSIGKRLPGSRASRKPGDCARLWEPEIEKLHRLDEHPWERVQAVMRWSQADSFWQKNILSGKKLREKFETLMAQAQPGSQSRKGRPDGQGGHHLPEDKVYPSAEIEF